MCIYLPWSVKYFKLFGINISLLILLSITLRLFSLEFEVVILISTISMSGTEILLECWSILELFEFKSIIGEIINHKLLLIKHGNWWKTCRMIGFHISKTHESLISLVFGKNSEKAGFGFMQESEWINCLKAKRVFVVGPFVNSNIKLKVSYSYKHT